jgi:hypothetical protein
MAANFDTFDYETPQEAQEKQRQKFLQGLSTQGQDPLGQLGFTLGQAFSGGFKESPEVTRAKALEAAVKSADESFNTSVKDQPPANDIEKELRRVQLLRDRVADIDPETAAQLNTQLLMLGEAKFQRDRLRASDKREEESHELTIGAKRDEAAVRRLTGGLTYVLDRQTGKAKSFDLLDANSSAGFTDEARKPSSVVLTPSQVFDLHKLQTQESFDILQRLQTGNDNSKVVVKDALRASDAVLDLYNTTDRIFDIVSTNPDALTSTSAAGKKLDSFVTELGAAARAVNGNVTREGTSINGWMKGNGITNQRMQGLITGIAYSVARANDGTGRISDKDLEAAKMQVGGDNPNPQAILSNMNDILTVRGNTLVQSLDTLPPGYQVDLRKRRELLGEKQAAWNKKFGEYAQGNARAATGIGTGQVPVAPGFAPSAPDKDGWTIQNGVKIRRKGGAALSP